MEALVHLIDSSGRAIRIAGKRSGKKELLEHYEDKSYLYGKWAQDLQSHTPALIAITRSRSGKTCRPPRFIARSLEGSKRTTPLNSEHA